MGMAWLLGVSPDIDRREGRQSWNSRWENPGFLGWILANHKPLTTVEIERLLDHKKARNPLVAANKNLLKLVRRSAIKEELLAMKLRGRLVVPVEPERVGGKKGLATG